MTGSGADLGRASAGWSAPTSFTSTPLSKGPVLPSVSQTLHHGRNFSQISMERFFPPLRNSSANSTARRSAGEGAQEAGSPAGGVRGTGRQKGCWAAVFFSASLQTGAVAGPGRLSRQESAPCCPSPAGVAQPHRWESGSTGEGGVCGERAVGSGAAAWRDPLAAQAGRKTLSPLYTDPTCSRGGLHQPL